MADTGSRIVGPFTVPTSPLGLYNPPVGGKTIMRGMRVANVGAAAAKFTLCVGTVAIGTALWWETSVPVGDAIDWHGFLVLEDGDELSVDTDVANTLTLTISGIEIT